MSQPMPDPGWSPIIITAREVYDAVVRVSAKVDLLDIKLTDISTNAADHETRLRALERARWPFPSVAILISIGALAAAIFIR